jgi:hypothetical protein
MEGRFSDRMGVTTPPALQFESMNDDLRNSLWNLIDTRIHTGVESRWIHASERLADGFFKVRIDQAPRRYFYEARDWTASLYFKLPWWGVYNLIEFLRSTPDPFFGVKSGTTFEHAVNYILKREAAGYQFLAGKLSDTALLGGLAISLCGRRCDRSPRRRLNLLRCFRPSRDLLPQHPRALSRTRRGNGEQAAKRGDHDARRTSRH